MITAHMTLFDIIKRKLRNKYHETISTTKDS
jgi:hypothetical protein